MQPRLNIARMPPTPPRSAGSTVTSSTKAASKRACTCHADQDRRLTALHVRRHACQARPARWFRRIAVDAHDLGLARIRRSSPRRAGGAGWIKALTLLPESRADDEYFEPLRARFSNAEIARLTVAVSTINVWNRIARRLPATSIPSSGGPKLLTSRLQPIHRSG